MRPSVYWRAAVVVAATLGGGAVPPVSDLGILGVAPAEAKAFYTRKRVNGRWITGRFAKKHFAKKQTVAKASRSARRSAETSAPERAPVSTVFAALSRPEPAMQPTPAAGARPARATLAQAAPPAATGAPLVPLSEDERLGKLREALQARANALTTGSLEPPQGPRPAPEPQSVSLDFKSGTKTTQFSDGTAVTEPFDVGALKGLAATPPRAKAGLE